MKQNTLNRGLIQAIAKRTIHHIQENPERKMHVTGLSKLFVKGPFGQEFFAAAGLDLEKRKSHYYQIASNAIGKTDGDHLLTFGMNFGYNSLTCGVQQIQILEESEGYHVPWTMFITVSGEGKLDVPRLGRLIAQGKTMGIFTWIIRSTKSFHNFRELCVLLRKHEDCAFIVLTKPESLLAATVLDHMQRPENLLLCLQINHTDPHLLQKASTALHRRRILCAAYYRAGPTEHIDIKKAAGMAVALDFSLLLTQHNEEFYRKNRAAIEQSLMDTRPDLQLPLIPFDIFSDAVLVDRNISSEGCLITVDQDGILGDLHVEKGEAKNKYDIAHTPLSDILRTALPR